MKVDTTFSGTLAKTDGFSWTYVHWPESVKALGTGKSVKTISTIDGHEFQITFMAWGDGTHILPVNAKIRKELSKDVGDTIKVYVKETL